MFKTKTFNLLQEEENKKFEKLYDPKRCRWIRYIVISALIGFVVLLVLVNVDFSANLNSSINSNTTSTTSSSSSTELVESEVTEKIAPLAATTTINSVHVESSYQLQQSFLLTALVGGCTIIGRDYCYIDCYGGRLDDLPTELANKQLFCKGDLYVQVRSYNLTGTKLKAQHLTGTFQVAYLLFDSATNYNIAEIEEGAFDTASMANLKTLILENFKVKILSERTFQGLSLEMLYMTILHKNFNGRNFLQPIATSLARLVLQHSETDAIFDPTNWLQGAYFITLWHLDLSDINFDNKLRRQTFAMLKAVRVINLQRCQISNIAKGTFDDVAYTLQSLYLNSNQLKTLDMNFLSNIVGKLVLRLGDNIWDCTCNNYQLITACNSEEINCGEPKCTTPENDKPFSYIDLECGTATTTITTTAGDPTSTTPNSQQYRNLYCTSTSFSSTEEADSITVRDYDAYFSFNAQTEHSVTLVVKSNMEDLYLIYFVPTTSTYINATTDDLATPIDSQTTEINVQGLLPDQLYVFCLILRDELKISPFNCLSYYLQTAHLQKSAFLNKDDLAWVLIVSFAGLTISFCCGLIATFIILRWRPTWLYGSKRIIRKGSKSCEVYLKPNKLNDEENAEMGAACGKSDIKTDDYMQFHKDLLDSRNNRTLQVGVHMSRYVRAPSTPMRSQSRTTTICVDVIMEDIDEEGIYY